ncbi:hypothetical protein Taro_034304 [Colocasia esculenta]|uniref:Uncharacterized protein n=1 Tax=Colocasia esculenta TaxID=4460 RepID=A0A843W0F6_COLES|nr:hypothetical protein [Colocasia esculenta]
MAGVSNLRACWCEQRWTPVPGNGMGLRPDPSARRGAREVRIARVSEGNAMQIGRLSLNQPKEELSQTNRNHCVKMALVDARPTYSLDVALPAGVLAYDLVQGALVSLDILPFHLLKTKTYLHVFGALCISLSSH